jgi:CRISPR-associated protein Cst1
MNEKTITLYPSNWLYNAGVVGLMQTAEKVNSGSLIAGDNGSVSIDLSKLSESKAIDNATQKISRLGWYWLKGSWDQLTKKEAVTEKEIIAEIWGKLFNVHYRGFFNANTKLLFTESKKSKAIIEQFNDFIDSFEMSSDNKVQCQFCNTKSNANYKNRFTSEHSNVLGGSAGIKGVPNSFWNMNSDASFLICDFCSFVLLNHHLALTKLSDYSEICINAPSFKLMYELNKIVKESYGSTNNEEPRNKRELLAMTIIEHSNKIKTTLGMWAGMNIEIVTKKRNEIEFFSLPYEIIKIISDRNIAALLSELGEFRILNMILNKKFSGLIDFAYKLIRVSTKNYMERNKSEKDLINDLLFKSDNKMNLTSTANKILKLYSLIEEKNKRS